MSLRGLGGLLLYIRVQFSRHAISSNLHQLIHFVFMNIDAEIRITHLMMYSIYTRAVLCISSFCPIFFYNRNYVIPIELLIRAGVSTVKICFLTWFLVRRVFVPVCIKY